MEKYFVFSSGICDLNKEVSVDDIANNLFSVIKTAVDNGTTVVPLLTINCQNTSFGDNVIYKLNKLIEKNDIKEKIKLEIEKKEAPMGAENSDMYNRSKTSKKVKELLEQNEEAKIACIYKIDQDDKLSPDMIRDSIKILSEENNKNLSLVYPVNFMFKDKNKNEYVLDSIKDNIITVHSISNNTEYKITKNPDGTFLCEPKNDLLDNNFNKLLFSKTYLAGTVNNPLNHNYGQFRVDIIRDLEDFKNKQKIISINNEELTKYSIECYKQFGIKEKPLPLLVDWIYKISPFEISERNIENNNLMLMSYGSTMSKEDGCLKENIIARRALSVIYMYLYNYYISPKDMSGFFDKMDGLINTVLPAKADKEGRHSKENIIDLFFNQIKTSIDVLKKNDTIPFFTFQDNKLPNKKETDKMLDRFYTYIDNLSEYKTLKSPETEFNLLLHNCIIFQDK